ncbi:hypothetical protein DPMN_102524 [Dreissena polymorpha]|uniref:Uncharacterized protein n=1 Tax=Dreissena polymorpha TaxID=45954 RepID=A0A9D4LJH3_DREPO|nr:hypothetical protein DPMN_102524 [Dreissena polymorpha]
MNMSLHIRNIESQLTGIPAFTSGANEGCVFRRNIVVFRRNIVVFRRNIVIFLRNIVVFRRNIEVFRRNIVAFGADGIGHDLKTRMVR